MARLLLSVALLLAAGCALRPRYNDVLPQGATGEEAHLVLTDKASGRPLAGVPIEVGDGKAKLKRVTDAAGVFSLPVDAALVKANPMLVVTLPAGVAEYEVQGHRMTVREGTPRGDIKIVPVLPPEETDGPEWGGITGEVKPGEAPASEEAPAATDGGMEPVSL